MDLKGKVALVTGGSRGIGQAISEELASRGAHVFLGATKKENAEGVAGSIRDGGGLATAVGLNVKNPAEIGKVFDAIASDFKPIDILVNNAGINRDTLAVRMKESDWDEVVAVNLKGAFLCCQRAIKQMMKQRAGAIVNISSVVGQAGNFGQANYTASKAGLIGMTKTLALEVASRGIRVNAVAPGLIDTDMTRGMDEKIREGLLAKIPLGRLGDCREVAYSVAFLVSDQAEYITGQVININGGMLM